MADSVVVRRFTADEWPIYRQLRLAALADSPDAFGSTLAIEEARSDNEWATRLASGVDAGPDLALIAEICGEAAGLAWARFDDPDASIVNVYQMWVTPRFRGCGAGRLLLRSAIEWARRQSAKAVQLGVKLGDTPAMHLYTAHGFRPVGPPGSLRPGSLIRGQTMQLLLNERAA